MSEFVMVDHLDFAYNPSTPVLNQISLSIQEREIVSLLGPSGSGKSTLLNLVAGFLSPTGGRLSIHGRPIQKPDSDRGVVFQDLALFPWLTVRKNVAFGLKMQGVPKEIIEQKVQESLQMVGLAGYEDYAVQSLSGGMKQRVALARTLVTEPEILLMDEPFSALDAQTRESLQDELLRIHEETQMTILLVTHSVDEAIYLSDRVAVLSDEGTLQVVETVNLGASRNRSSEAFNHYRSRLYQWLKQENKQEVAP